MIDVEEADLVVVAFEDHDEGVDKLQSLDGRQYFA